VSDSALCLLVMVGALLIAAGCSRPLNVAVATANAAAVGLEVTRAAIIEARKAEQLAAARRVVGDRSDPAVKAEQLDRAQAVGHEYRKIWDAYDAAWQAWATAARFIHEAQLLEKAGKEPDLQTITKLLIALADAQRKLSEVFQHD
jgi:hypothetical protein